MASSGNVEVVVLEPAAVEQPPVQGCEATASTEESQPMLLQERRDAAPEADDHREAVAAPQQALDVEASAPVEEQPGDEQQEPAPVANSKEEGVEPEAMNGGGDQESSRERLKRHRQEMAGRVWVPDMWGQEKLLKDWVDCAVFDRPLVPPGLLTARRALITESCARRRPDRTTSPASSAGSSKQLRVRNGC